MISKYRYSLSAIIVFIALILFFNWCIVSLATTAGGRFIKTISEMKSIAQVSQKQDSTDFLLEQYRSLSVQMDSFLNAKGTASDILKHLLELSQKHQVVLLDLSTREPEQASQSIEYPVSFQAQGTFPAIHLFLTDVENSELCIKVSMLRIEREELGTARAFVELSVFIREK